MREEGDATTGVYKAQNAESGQHSTTPGPKATISMYKLVLLPLFFAAASAGYLGAPAVATYAAAPVAVAAPLAVASPLAVKAIAPVATSYANIHKVDIATPVVKTVAAPVAIHAAPVAYAAPAAYAAPLAYASYGLH